MGGLVAVDSVSTAVVDTDRAEVVDIDGTELRWPGQSFGPVRSWDPGSESCRALPTGTWRDKGGRLCSP